MTSIKCPWCLIWNIHFLPFLSTELTSLSLKTFPERFSESKTSLIRLYFRFSILKFLENVTFTPLSPSKEGLGLCKYRERNFLGESMETKRIAMVYSQSMNSWVSLTARDTRCRNQMESDGEPSTSNLTFNMHMQFKICYSKSTTKQSKSKHKFQLLSHKVNFKGNLESILVYLKAITSTSKTRTAFPGMGPMPRAP